MKKLSAVAAIAGIAVFATAAFAEVIFNADGTGFVGKGDVQLALTMNNKQLQEAEKARAIAFTSESVTTQETTWTCDRDAGPQTNERSSTATTTTKGLVSHTERDNKKQITGFRLTGFDPNNSSSSSVTDGPKVGACASGWTAINIVEGELVSTGGGLRVNGVDLQ